MCARECACVGVCVSVDVCVCVCVFVYLSTCFSYLQNYQFSTFFNIYEAIVAVTCGANLFYATELAGEKALTPNL